MTAPAPTPTPTPTPANSSELVAILTALRSGPVAAPPPERDRGELTKTIVGGIVALIGAIVLGLVFWVGTSVSDLGTSVTKMSANVDQLNKSIGDLQQSQGLTAQQLSDGKATDARQDARMDAVDADVSRMKERLRIVEGQKPLGDMATIRTPYP